MSTTACRVKSGIVALDSAIRRAIVCCARVSSTVVVSPFAVATPSAGAAGAGGGAGAPAAREAAGAPAPCTSAFTIRPPGPWPLSARRSTPLSRAIRLARGEALTRSPAPSRTSPGALAGAAGASEPEVEGVSASARTPAGPGAGLSSIPVAADGRSAPERSAPVPSTCAIRAPTASVSPSAATVRTVPARSDS